MKLNTIILSLFFTVIAVNGCFAAVYFDTTYATQINGNVEINWATSAEVNNQYFTIERSIDSINFTSISNVNGAGSSSSIITYSLTDSTVASGQTYYYRIKQTDFDGQISYSDIVSLLIDPSLNIEDFSSITFQVYPNPVLDNLNIVLDISDFNNHNYEIRLTNYEGKTVRSMNVVNNNQLMINRNNLDGGLYFIQVYSDSKMVASRKIIFQ